MLENKSTGRKPGHNAKKGVKGFIETSPIIPVAPTPAIIPNQMTIEAMKEVRSGNLPKFENVKALLEELNTPVLLDLSTDEMTEFFLKSSIICRKFARVNAVQVGAGVEIRTVLDNGSEETVNISKEGDFLISNPGGEQYLIGSEKFNARYAPTDQENIYQASGHARVLLNPTERPIKIIAPWGSEQFGAVDCLVATTYDPAKPNEVSRDRYIIGRDELLDTYARLGLSKIPYTLVSSEAPTPESIRDVALFKLKTWRDIEYADHLRRVKVYTAYLKAKALSQYDDAVVYNTTVYEAISFERADLDRAENLRYNKLLEENDIAQRKVIQEYESSKKD